MGSYDDFWGKAGPGMLEMGVGLYNKNAAQKEAAKRLALSQGSLYGSAMAGAGATLGEAGSFNPDALAANRFNAGEAMVAPVQAKNEADLMRLLYAKGMLGTANYNPGKEGITPNGTAMNPHMAAFYAAQNADRTKRANSSLMEGQEYANNLVNRASSLQQIAGNTQATGLIAQNPTRPGGMPSQSTGNAELLKGVAGMFSKNPGMLKDIWNWGSGLFGGGGFSGADLAADFGGFASW